MYDKYFLVKVETRDDGEPSPIDTAAVLEALRHEFDKKQVASFTVMDVTWDKRLKEMLRND